MKNMMLGLNNLLSSRFQRLNEKVKIGLKVFKYIFIHLNKF